MPVSNSLKRLLRIRDLEQEQHRIALESALTELRSLEAALAGATERERTGRVGFSAGVHTGEFLTRHSALAESSIGGRHIRTLSPALSRAEAEAMRRRQVFLHKRMELRQAETLIEEAASAGAIEQTRQGQRAHDEWFLSRTLRAARESASESSPEESSNLSANPSATMKISQE